MIFFIILTKMNYGGIKMNFEINEMYYGFKLLKEEYITEVQSTARIFQHVKSGARLLHLANEDDNKLFSIGFRTTPTDSTGVAHILEHSVLCGSKRFKTKDPFGEIGKSSLHTFLNAMTYTDKTVYPVASRNSVDFMNLMTVYLDAVLNPKIYENHEILRQEGWRYEIDPETNKLIYKGVVYSEMQGALSSPQEVLCSEIYRTVFPDTTYEYVSGGAPEDIPNLTQEDFENFHSKFYHPSNSYMFLYGDQDLDKCLKFIDEEFLCEFDAIEIPSKIEDTQEFLKPIEKNCYYSIGEEEEIKNKAYLALSFGFGETKNPMDLLTSEILYNMLIESSASPIKKALYKAGIGESMITKDDMNMDPTKEILFPIVVKNAEEAKKYEFKEIILNTLKKVTIEGIDKDQLKAAINTVEFNLREADPWRTANKGIQYMGRVLESWIYDGDPLIHLKYEEALNKIKAGIENRYFEEYIEKNMLKNNHSSLVVLVPERGLEARKVKALEEKLENYKNALSKEELEALILRNEKLKEEQIRKDTEEEKKTMPRLSIEEIEKKAEEIPQIVDFQDGVTILAHPISTNKIGYINFLFDGSVIEEKDIPYLGLLSNILGEVDTKDKPYLKLITEINKITGGIEFSNQVYTEKNNGKIYHPKFIIKAKAVLDNIKETLRLIEEIINTTAFEDLNRIKQIISEEKSKLQMKNISAGNTIGGNKVLAMVSLGEEYKERINGAKYYNFLCRLEAEFDTKAEDIRAIIARVYEGIFNKNNLIISIVCDKEDIDKIKENLGIVLDKLSQREIKQHYITAKAEGAIQGIITASNVQYVVKGFNFAELGRKYSGKMKVLQNILDNEYLYPMVRLQGGAYGCYMNLSNDGNVSLYSYRDPNLLRTIKVYDDTHSFLEKINYSKEDMEKFIIGTVGQTYRPLTPDKKGEAATKNYICNISFEELQQERDEILSTTVEEVKAYAELFDIGMKENYCCVVGNEGKIKEAKEIFNNIEVLL